MVRLQQHQGLAVDLLAVEVLHVVAAAGQLLDEVADLLDAPPPDVDLGGSGGGGRQHGEGRGLHQLREGAHGLLLTPLLRRLAGVLGPHHAGQLRRLLLRGALVVGAGRTARTSLHRAQGGRQGGRQGRCQGGGQGGSQAGGFRLLGG